MQRNARMLKELKMLAEDPPHGVSCWKVDGQIDHLEAKIIGAEGTPYQGGIFKIDIQIPERYPFQPPKMRFVTPIYHPNIDSSGRICLDTIKMPPKGMWKPALNIGSVLSTILLLMDKPNPDDPLMADISHEFSYNYSKYFEKAKEWTLKYATEKQVEPDEKPVELDEKQEKHETNNNQSTLQTEDSSSSDSDSDSENMIDTSTRKRLSTDQPSASGMKPNKVRKL